MPLFCTGTALPAPSLGGTQNGVFCRLGIFWRMRADGQDHAEMPAQPKGPPLRLTGATAAGWEPPLSSSTG